MRDWRPFCYGGVASVIAECGTFPIDTTKTRLQIQGQKIDAQHAQLKYRGMMHAVIRISSEEGLRSLYSGIAPALLRQASYGTIKIGIYHSMKRYFCADPKDESLLVNVFCGIVAGVVSSSLANPTDVLKVRMQAQGHSSEQLGVFQSFKDIYTKEGVKGLWRGVSCTAQRAGIVVGVELPIYDLAKYLFIHKYGIMGDTPSTHFISSSIAGLAGAIASNPVDVVKTRMMNQRKLKGKQAKAIYSSSVQCLVQTVRTEGFFALYKGFIPTWVRLGPWNVIFFMAYEQLNKVY
ncbi:kidney mitochondrial carrier protein 1-like [Lingula anatina]|uniref:Kidney mitochondrial carrier protein 1 n=1 Tax=Lingula anatina TaxID=7574 RepID=A0A1S3HDE7_LINAN|nr:kidney mitochondrial carrier protein 1 [Lingula anatina]XP_013418530.1 kidney mitochondrial carrier protein 1-like [Lingula anatina]|eukprot:XP_013383541.1 kidney mitochondrial carrier protein 1 [Lingula anatina]